MSITATPYGFNPALTAGLVLWLDASDPTTITQSSGNITQWRDKSTSALTATAVNNPTLVANVQNGFPGISFDGSTQYFNLGNNLNMGTNQIYIFIVSKFNSTADGAIIGKSLLGSQGGRYSLLRVGALVPLIEAGGGVVNNSGLNSDTSTSARLLNMVWDRSTINLYQNGSSVFSVGLSDSSNLTTGNSLLIGAYQNGSGGTPPATGLFMNGYIHEILMYFTSTASPLGNTARQQIESYLAQKWGLTLGAGHPGLTSTVYRSTYLRNSAVKRNIATMTPFFTGFSPRQIPACALWLDGADSSTISFSSGSNVSTWSDKSGNGRNATVYAGTPTYTSALGMTFNGSSSLQITYTASPILESMFVIIKFNSVSGQGDILSGTAAGQREYLMYVPYSPGTIYLGRHSTGPSGAINGGTVTTGSNYLLGYVFNGTGNTISFFQSGNTITSGTPQFTYSAGGTISVIGSYNGGGYLQGQIYEMIIYSTALSITERQRVESYLAQKWGLTSSLPGSHLHLTQPAGARTALSLANSKFSLTSRPPIVVTIGNFTSIVGGAAGGGLWMTAVTPNGDIYTKSYNPTVYRLRDTTYSNPFSCDNWGQGLTTDGTFVYGTDTNSAQIFRFNPANSTRNLLLNNITSPCGLAADGIGNIYISQQIWQNPNNTLIRYNISANTSTTLYNVALSTYYFAGMAPDGLGNLYLSDYVTNKIYKLNSSNVLSAVAGSGTAGFADGIGAAASFNISMYINFSNNLCYDGNGNLYLAETNNNRIRKIVIATGLVTTIAGTGVSGTVNGPALSARLTAPLGISYANGYLYWCEDKIVRRLTL
jgi:hypothetical protein